VQAKQLSTANILGRGREKSGVTDRRSLGGGGGGGGEKGGRWRGKKREQNGQAEKGWGFSQKTKPAATGRLGKEREEGLDDKKSPDQDRLRKEAEHWPTCGFERVFLDAGNAARREQKLIKEGEQEERARRRKGVKSGEVPGWPRAAK